MANLTNSYSVSESVRGLEPEFFLQLHYLQGYNFLLRGYLHDVNNALAGIGTLAEVMKTSKGQNLARNLDLMGNATQKASVLQQRIRSLYPDTRLDDAIAIEFSINEFLSSHKDLLELMLPHSQRLRMQLQPSLAKVNTSIDNLWRFFSLIMVWIRHSQASTCDWVWTSQGHLSIRLALPSGTAPAQILQSWKAASEDLGRILGVRVVIGNELMEIQFDQ